MKTKAKNPIIETPEKVVKIPIIRTPKTETVKFKSEFRQEHFKIKDVMYLFRNFKLTVLDCSDSLKAEILKHRSIKLDK